MNPAGSGLRRHWPKIRRLLSWAFVVLLLALLATLASRLDWREVLRTLTSYQAPTFWLAGAATAASYLVYSLYDVLGKRYVRHRLPLRQVLPLTFVCYAFNLNLGAWIGGIALRYRFYARLGLRAADITRIFTFSLLTNWLAYLALAGAIFLTSTVSPPPGWELGGHGLRLLGAGSLALSLGYLALCFLARRREWRLRGHEIVLPGGRLAALQLTLGAANWALMAAVVYFMLLQRIPYAEVLGILLISAMAGVIAHIPAGLGVTEAVFVALLAGRLGHASVVAGLIGYRVVYYLAPLGVATLVYALLESRTRRAPTSDTAPPPGGSPGP